MANRGSFHGRFSGGLALKGVWARKKKRTQPRPSRFYLVDALVSLLFVFRFKQFVLDLRATLVLQAGGTE